MVVMMSRQYECALRASNIITASITFCVRYNELRHEHESVDHIIETKSTVIVSTMCTRLKPAITNTKHS